MHRTMAARPSGTGWPVRWAAAAIRAGMSPGGRNTGSSGSMTVTSGGCRAAAPSRSGRSTGGPASAQPRTDSCSSHNPITLRR